VYTTTSKKEDATMTREFPKLTKLEAEILDHRLSVVDALIEVLEEYHESDVLAVVAKLKRGELAEADRFSRRLTNDVLADCVEGSTFLGAASQESDQKQNAIYRAGESLAKKIGDLIGRKLQYPTG
jgi:hypothetical protein